MSWLRDVAAVLRDPFSTANSEAIGFLLIGGLALVVIVLAVVLFWHAVR